jgi:NTP pyrophosphatase (non-canonical NTP hydrolase)
VKVADYDNFVRRTDQYKDRSPGDRRVIAIYGLVGEIGSLGSAMKKRLLSEGGQQNWDQPNDEIVEEIGDVIWYCFSLAQVDNASTPINILTHDIALLKREISGQNKRAQKIRAALDGAKKVEFLEAAASFPSTKNMTFDHYQVLAFHTARTRGKDLLDVCIAVLWQLGAELLRNTLPDIELTLNKHVADRPINTVLGEIAWHLSAIATLVNLSLDDIVTRNVEKVSFRANRDKPTPLHDSSRGPNEQLPRQFAISIVSLGPHKSRMYLDGKQLGNDLTDNSYEDDGYRFHDVWHLANVAHLGWSPVIRKFMKRKRKSGQDLVDEVEDGARAEIVEELVIKAIHTEGNKLAKQSGRCASDGPVRTFPSRGVITFRLLKSLREHVEGHEVAANQYWEWENAIFDGADLYFRLREETQGTVNIDMDSRSISFSPDVYVALSGAAVGSGLARARYQTSSEEAKAVLTPEEFNATASLSELGRLIAAKRAIMQALALDSRQFGELRLKLIGGRYPSVKASGSVQSEIWARNVITFQLAFVEDSAEVMCTATAVTDVKDVA